MTLTPDDTTKLNAPFALKEYEFLRGNIYITEEAINRRLTSVDPDWKFIGNTFIQVGDTVMANRTLIIKGVARSNVGAGEIQTTDKAGNPITGYALAVNVGNAYKAAVTDALKRCARMHGVGLHILDIPKSVSDEAALAKWLNTPAAPTLVPQPRTDPRHTPPTLTSADIEAALKGEGTPWHEYRIEHNQAGNMQIVLKSAEGLQDAKEAVAAKGFKIINAGRNWFVVEPQTA